MNKYKVEGKGSLFEVVFKKGCYSDREELHFCFSGNTIDEVWEFVKIWIDAGGFDYCFYSKFVGFIFDGQKHIVEDKDNVYGYSNNRDDINWDIAFGDSWDVSISRLNVIYVNP